MFSLEKLSAYLTVNDVTAGESDVYDGVQPVVPSGSKQEVTKSVRRAFEAGGSRWSIREILPGEGRLEGTVTTPVFGFVDDLTVRLEPFEGEPSDGDWRVVARSRSRVGRGDLGKNARNLRTFYSNLRDSSS